MGIVGISSTSVSNIDCTTPRAHSEVGQRLRRRCSQCCDFASRDSLTLHLPIRCHRMREADLIKDDEKISCHCGRGAGRLYRAPGIWSTIKVGENNKDWEWATCSGQRVQAFHVFHTRNKEN